MLARFFKRRTVWWPTWPVWLVLFGLTGVPFIVWAVWAEAFLSVTERQPADVLVVEGWIGADGVLAAKQEFERGGYRYLVTSGGEIHPRWHPDQWNYALEARKVLLRAGLPADRVIEAPAPDTMTQRTFVSAVIVRQTIAARIPEARAVNIFTTAAHARRSRMVFAKALGAGLPVGTVAWIPPTHGTGGWWTSSERALDLFKETLAYAFELTLNSGRFSHSPTFAGVPSQPATPP